MECRAARGGQVGTPRMQSGDRAQHGLRPPHPIRWGTRGAPLCGAKGKPEDAEMRRATHVIQVCMVVESTIWGWSDLALG